jgi:sugar phosphate isomerase/epimerase
VRLGITYLYTIFRYGYPHSVDDALRSIGEVRNLGFRFLEMEGLGREMLSGLYARRGELVETAQRHGVEVHNFCIVDPDLVSLDGPRQRRALEHFRLGAKIAALLEARTLHLASYAPPVEYRGSKPYELAGGSQYAFGDQFAVHLPGGFDWERVWAALVESCQACADIAADFGKTVIMEPRVGEVICSVDSLLRLMEHVGRPNFKANFDTGHFSAQRENVVLALAKLHGRFANIHISDNRPETVDHLPIGDGAIDWLEFFRVLKQTGYSGYLGLDLGLSPTLLDGYRRSVKRVQEIASQLAFAIEV